MVICLLQYYAVTKMLVFEDYNGMVKFLIYKLNYKLKNCIWIVTAVKSYTCTSTPFGKDWINNLNCTYLWLVRLQMTLSIDRLIVFLYFLTFFFAMKIDSVKSQNLFYILKKGSSRKIS